MNLCDRRHWIFDMDGTLTQPVHDFESIRQTLGIPGSTPILEYISTLPTEDAQRIRRELDEIEMDLAAEAVAQPGASDLLRLLLDLNMQVGILTRNGEEIAHATLDACGLRHFFYDDVIVGRETCLPKPMPDGVVYLMNHWSADPTDTVMVGDYLYDIEAGRRAGVATVHYSASGTYPWPEFTDFGVSSIAELLAFFDSYR